MIDTGKLLTRLKNHPLILARDHPASRWLVAVVLGVLGLVVTAPTASATDLFHTSADNTSWYVNTIQGWADDYRFAPVYAYVDSAADGGRLDVSGMVLDRYDCSQPTDSLKVEVKAPTGAVTSKTFEIKAACGGVNLTGLTGLTSDTAGVWTVTFTAAPAGSANSNLVVSVTPKLNGEAKPGRVWTNQVSVNQRGAYGLDTRAVQAPTAFSLHTLGPDGIQHTLTLPSLAGWNSVWAVDNIGMTADGCTPLYHSVNEDVPLTSTGKVATQASPSCPGYTRYRLFFEEPDATMPVGPVPIAGGSTWAFKPYDGSEAGVRIASVVPYAPGRPPTAATVTVTNTGSVTGKVSLYVDADDDGDHTDPADGLVGSTGQLNPGESATIAWDGKDASGGPLAASGWSLVAELDSAGEVHFTNRDVEWNAMGAQIVQTVGPAAKTEAADLVWWNDDDTDGFGTRCVNDSAKFIACDFSAIPDFAPKKVGAAGAHSTGGTAHAWGRRLASGLPSGADSTWGNQRWIDDWQTISATAADDFWPEKAESPRLSITKTDDRTTVGPNERLTWKITVTNAGGPLTDGVVIDRLPANVTFVSASDGGAHADGIVSWTGVSVPADGTATRTVTATVDPTVANGETVSNIAFVCDAAACPPPPACDAASLCALDADEARFPVLSVTKTDGVTAAKPGDRLTYTVTAKNTGLAAVAGASLVDRLPPGLTFVSASDGGVADGQSVTWPGVTIGAGASVIRTVTAKVDVDIPRPASLRNRVMLAPDPKNPPECWASGADGALCASDVDAVPAPTLVVTKDDGVDIAQPGQVLTYEVAVSNRGDGDATNMSVYDLLPAHTTFVSASDGGGLDGRTVVWSGLNLAAGKSLTRTVTVSVAENIPRPAQIRNLATAVDQVTPKTPAPDCRSGCAADVDVVPTPGLAITKTDGVAIARPGDTLTYVLTVANSGQGDSLATNVIDALPAHVTLVGLARSGPVELAPEPGPAAPPDEPDDPDDPADADPDDPDDPADADPADADPGSSTGEIAAPPVPTDAAWTPLASSDFTIDDGSVRINPFRLPANQATHFRVVVTVDEDVPRPSRLTNLASVADGESEPDCEKGAQSCAADTDDVPSFDLRIAKDMVDADLVNGGLAQWRVTISNHGTGDARDVVVTDQLPAQVDPASVTWDEPPIGGIADGRWRIGVLPAGAEAEVLVFGTIDQPDLAAGDVITNTVRVTSPDDPDKGDPSADCLPNDEVEADSDGCDEATVTVPGTTLSVSKTDGVTTAEPGDTLTYEIHVANTGFVDEPKAVVTDFLPEHAKFVSASDGGRLDGEGRVVWRRPVPTGKTAVLSVTVTVARDVPRPSELVNHVTVAGTGTTVPPADPTQECPPGVCAADTDLIAVGVKPATGPAPRGSVATGGAALDGTLARAATVASAAVALAAIASAALACRFARRRAETDAS